MVVLNANLGVGVYILLKRVILFWYSQAENPTLGVVKIVEGWMPLYYQFHKLFRTKILAIQEP